MKNRKSFTLLGLLVAVASVQCGTEPNPVPTNASITDAGIESGIPFDAADDAAADSGTSLVTANWLPVPKWLLVPGLEGCEGMSLNLAVTTWPSRIWTPCGTGCLSAPAAIIPGQNAGGTDHSGASVINGETYVRTVTWGKTENYQELRRMSDGATVFVLKFSSNCYVAAGQGGAPLFFEVVYEGPDENSLSHWIGRFNLSTGKLKPHPGVIVASPFTPSWMMWNGGWGVLDGGAVRLAIDPNQADLTTVYLGVGSQANGIGYGDMVAWVDYGAWPTPIRSFTNAGGQKVLIPPQNWAVFGFTMSADRIAWAGGRGPDVQLGIYASAELYWSPFATDPAAIQVTKGPSLTGKVAGPVAIGASGDFIALSTVGDSVAGTSPGTYVTQVSTGKLWFIPARPDTWVNVAVVNADEILIMETPISQHGAYFQNYIRYELAKLDEIGQPIVQ